MNNQNDLALLELICQEVERLGLDLAPTYDAWVTVAYGLATDFGEAGREAFHRICRQYAKGYRREDTDRCYTYCLAHSRGQVHFGSVLLLAREAGVDTAGLRAALAAQRRAERSDGTAGAAAGAGGGAATGAGGGTATGAAGGAGVGAAAGAAGGAGADAGAGAGAGAGGAAGAAGASAAGGAAALSPGMVAAGRGLAPAGVRARAYPMAGQVRSAEGAAGELVGSEPLAPLPLLDEGCYAWPRLLLDVVEAASVMDGRGVPTYRDVLLLGGLTALGAALGRTVRVSYSRRMQYPNLQTFVVAPPASGKGVLQFVRLLTDPIHDEMRQLYDRARSDYEQQKAVWDHAGRERQNMPLPKEPPLSMFYIPGNITGTGIHQLIIDNDGSGFIFELEADTVSTAVQSDYGHWSDTLRKCFDNAGISYFRRTGQEYREAKRTFVSVLLSGTPAQVAPLIPSAENGLFSRQVFYYMPGVDEFRNQFDADEGELVTLYRRLGMWMHEWLTTVRAAGRYQLLLGDAQKAAFNHAMSELFTLSVLVSDREMNSWVVRRALDLNRMLMVVALLRATEPTLLEVQRTGRAPRTLLYEPTLLEPTTGTNQARRRQQGEGMEPGFALFATDDDFRAVLNMARPLTAHALHVLSMLRSTTMTRRMVGEQMALYTALPEEFRLAEAKELGRARGLTNDQVEHWVYRWRDRRLLTAVDARGHYRKSALKAWEERQMKQEQNPADGEEEKH